MTLLAKARLVGNEFKCPNGRQVGGELLDHKYGSCSNQNRILVGKDANIFGLSWMSDGATISRIPLVNNLVMCADVIPTVMDIHDCTYHMDAGGKKDSKYLVEVMEEEFVKFDPERMNTDVLYFDGSANDPNCVFRLCVFYPRAYVFHGREHAIFIFFSDIAKIAPNKVCMCAFIFFVSFYTILLYCLTLNILQILIIKVCRMYNVFGSGAAHGIYAQFFQQSGVHNNRKRIGLLRGAGTRFATFFYIMMRLVRLQAPLIATIHKAIFSDLNFNEHVRSVVMDIENKTFCKAFYNILRSVYPAIRALCYCDSKVSAIDKIYHLSNCTTLAIERSFEMLNDDDMFGSIEGNGLEFELTEVLGPEVNNASYANIIAIYNSSENVITYEDEPMALVSQILLEWEQMKEKVEHDYSIAGWAISAMPVVRGDVVDCMNGVHFDAIKRVVTKLHEPTCTNKSR